MKKDVNQLNKDMMESEPLLEKIVEVMAIYPAGNIEAEYQVVLAAGYDVTIKEYRAAYLKAQGPLGAQVRKYMKKIEGT